MFCDLGRLQPKEGSNTPCFLGGSRKICLSIMATITAAAEREGGREGRRGKEGEGA